MTRPLALFFFAFTLTACGARSELLKADADCAPLEIGLLGNPGAYDSSELEQWLASSGAGVQRIQTTTTEPLTEEALQRFDVVVIDWLTRDYTASEAAIFGDWITAGGGVASMTGWNNVIEDDWHANSLLAPLGVAYSGPLISGPVTDFAPHPITKGLSSVVFKGGYAIADLGGAESTRTPIAFLPGDSGAVNVGYAVEMGDGRAFVWGDEWIEFLTQGADFPPRLWVQMFAWIAPPKRCVLVPPG